MLSDGAVTAEGPPDATLAARDDGPDAAVIAPGRSSVDRPATRTGARGDLRAAARAPPGPGPEAGGQRAFWAYLAAIIVVSYGGSLIVTAYRALHRPPPATAAAPRLMHAAPAALTALALLVFLVLLRDALWRGPVTVPQATADWLLGTPVSRRRLLRPRFRWVGRRRPAGRRGGRHRARRGPGRPGLGGPSGS